MKVLFLLIFISSVSSNSQFDDDHLLARIKRSKDQKVKADLCLSYHAKIKSKLLQQLGRTPYVVPKMNKRGFIDKEVDTIVDDVIRKGGKAEFNAIQLEQINSDISLLYNILSQQAYTIMYDSINNAVTDEEVYKCRKDIQSTGLISELTRLNLLGRLDAKAFLLKSDKSERDSYNKMGVYWQSIQSNTLLTNFQKEHIRTQLQFEMNSFIMDKVKREKVHRNSLHKLEAYYNELKTHPLIHPDSLKEICTILAVELSSLISNNSNSRNCLENVDETWEVIDRTAILSSSEMETIWKQLRSELSTWMRLLMEDATQEKNVEKINVAWERISRLTLLTSSEKSSSKTRLDARMYNMASEVADKCKSVEKIAALWKVIDSTALLTSVQRHSLENVLHTSVHAAISDRLKHEKNKAETIDLLWKEIKSTSIPTFSEKTPVKASMADAMIKIVKEEADKCTSVEKIDALWKVVISTTLLTSEQRHSLKSVLHNSIHAAISDSLKHDKMAETIDLLWKEIEATPLLTLSEKSSSKTRLDARMYKMATKEADKYTSVEKIDALWKVIDSTALLTSEQKHSLKNVLHTSVHAAISDRLKHEKNKAETIDLLWKEIESISILTFSEKTPARTQLQDEMKSLIKIKLNDDFVRHAPPNKNRGFWTNIQSSSLFSITKKEKLRISVVEEASLLIEDQLSEKKDLQSLGENVHLIREMINANDFLSYTNQELLITFANEYLLELVREGRIFRTSTALIQRKIQELIHTSMDKESKGIILRELNYEIYDFESGGLDNFNGIGSMLKHLFEDESLGQGYVYVYINSHCLPFIDSSRPLLREEFLRSVSYVGRGHGSRMFDHIAEIRGVMANIKKLEGLPLRKVDMFASILETEGRLIVVSTNIPMSDKELDTREAILIEYMLDNSYSISNSKNEIIPAKASKLSNEEKELIVYQTIHNLMVQYEKQQVFAFGMDNLSNKLPPTAPSKEMRKVSTVSSIHCTRDPHRVILWKYNLEQGAWIIDRPKFSELQSSYIKQNLPSHIRSKLPKE